MILIFHHALFHLQLPALGSVDILAVEGIAHLTQMQEGCHLHHHYLYLHG